MGFPTRTGKGHCYQRLCFNPPKWGVAVLAGPSSFFDGGTLPALLHSQFTVNCQSVTSPFYYWFPNTLGS